VNPISRVANDLREMRWAQVVVELVLLILGILIALAVDDWMEDRRDARTERQYLELLARDLDQDLEVLKEFVDFEERQTADGVMAYQALRREVAETDEEAVSRALSHLMTRRTLRLARATYTDLLSTGNIRLIRDTGLRDRIVRLYETNERLTTIIDRNNQYYVDQEYTAYLLETGLVAPRPEINLPALQAAMEAFAARIGTPVDSRDDRLWRLGPEDSERGVLTNKVWMRSLISYQGILLARTIIDDVSGVRQAIADELARRWSDARAGRPTG